jgi:hypothetical protein
VGSQTGGITAQGDRTSTSKDGRTTIQPEQTAEPRGVRLSVTALVTLVGALLAASISGTSLTFALVPGLKPDPKEKVGADLAVLALDTNVDYSAYGNRPGRHIVAKAKPEHPGNVFYIRAHIEGFKRQSVRLKWFIYDPNGERRPGSKTEASEQSIFEPDAPINTQVAQIWVREPGSFDPYGEWKSDEDENYFIRFELYSGDVLLAFKDSPTFDVAG